MAPLLPACPGFDFGDISREAQNARLDALLREFRRRAEAHGRHAAIVYQQIRLAPADLAALKLALAELMDLFGIRRRQYPI